MTIKTILLKIFFILSTCIALPSHAVIIEGNFKGTVAFSLDGDPGFGYTKVWSGDIVGTAASGSFWYDTDEVPINTATAPNTAFHNGFTNDWLHIIMNVDGKTFDISDSDPSAENVSDHELLWIYNHEADVNGSNIEMLYLSDSTRVGDFSGDYFYKSAIVEFYSYDYPVLDGTDIIQEFSWTDTGDPNYIAQAYFVTGGIMNGQKTYGSASLSISEFNVSIKDDVAVPEPSSAIMLILGLLYLGWRYRLNMLHKACPTK